MAVVIDNGDVIDGTLNVEAASNSAEAGQALADEFDGHVEVERDAGGRGGVANIVNTGRMREVKEAQVFAFVGKTKFAGQAVELNVGDEQVGLARCAIGEDRTFDVRDDGLNVGFVEAKDGSAVERDAI